MSGMIGHHAQAMVMSKLAPSRGASASVRTLAEQAPTIVALYRAPMPLTLNQTLVVGASKEEGSKNALILILLAQETPRAGEKGVDGQRTVEKKP